MEYSLDLFVRELRNVMYESKYFPFQNEETNLKKHKGRELHIKDVAFKSNPTIHLSDTTLAFDIGNFIAERDYPYYHILQDAPIIRKKGRATEKTRGSQDKVKNLGQRDYAIVSFNGKTYSKEYAKNVRGKRNSVIERATYFVDGKRMNARSLSYRNIHYKYIDTVLSNSVEQVALSFGGRIASARNTSLEDDYNESLKIEEMLNSFTQGE